MIVLITGASHTGKTCLAQKLLETRHFPYLSADHLKMGLIRSGQTDLTPCDDEKLTAYLWPILREIIKPAIENEQNLTIEGCYIPFDWQDSFDARYLSQIRFCCLVMSQRYIRAHFDDILAHENAVEHRLPVSDFSAEAALTDNQYYLEGCIRHGLDYTLIDGEYDLERYCQL